MPYERGDVHGARALTAPASVLSGSKRAVTLYQHGIASGEWYWRLDVPGYHYAEELAERGHASLTVDRLGYDTSDRPDGFGTCIGAEADIAHRRLFAGADTELVDIPGAGHYATMARSAPRTFDRIARWLDARDL